jgi:hypothetical protein
MEQHSSEHLIQ